MVVFYAKEDFPARAQPPSALHQIDVTSLFHPWQAASTAVFPLKSSLQARGAAIWRPTVAETAASNA